MTKVKVLWCDKNSDYVDSFIAATKKQTSNIEFVIKDEPVDAIQDVLNNKDYKLIISGQLFKHLSGTDFFEIILNNKIEIPFLLLTAQVDYNQFSTYDLWSSFDYMDKLKSNYFEVADKIQSLINRDVTALFLIHEKLKYFRIELGLSIFEMARILETSESEVLNNELDYKKVTYSYLAHFSRVFDIELNTLVKSSFDYFKTNIVTAKKNQTQSTKYILEHK